MIAHGDSGDDWGHPVYSFIFIDTEAPTHDKYPNLKQNNYLDL